ncbi:hypothetical protein FNV43_RR07943 [Rhamnella rubrinervis]|uniref:Scarecrow-like protein 13 n=1 Tax=Rhamnella rubrinervis TaxID=2594499 RepID=A0A8K0HFL7_9ROSA|nr:hypothetical protein FNV43_RR07943 [Rhamnella rubrinervis]
MFPDSGSEGKSVSFETYKERFFTLDSSSADGFLACDSPSAVSVLSNRSAFSPQGSQSFLSDPHHSPDNYSGSPITAIAATRRIAPSLINDKVDPQSDDTDLPRAMELMDVLGRMVSVSGEPIQRLGAYLLEGLRARLERSGSSIYKALKCQEPTSKELMSYMSILYQICPFWRFAYTSANVVIKEAVEKEERIHIIDFQIAQGSQWIPFIEDLAHRPGGPPFIRITCVDDSQSAFARGGGLQIVGERLLRVAESCHVPFEFHGAAMDGSEVELHTLQIRPGEAIVVNFPYVLHHMPDESVCIENHRDRLLRLVKSLSPKVMTLVEQESNTNTSPFFARFVETLDYYTAMFEGIDAAQPTRDDKQRISAEQHCVARDIVNMIACEGPDRVERHELFGKWRLRLMMDGFTPCPLSSTVTVEVKNLLKEYNENYRVEEKNGALYLGWKDRDMATSSAWR